MELKMLKKDLIWIRSKYNEIMLVECDEEGNLHSQITQKRMTKSEKGSEQMEKIDKLIKDIKGELDYIEEKAMDKEKGRVVYMILSQIHKRLLELKSEKAG